MSNIRFDTTENTASPYETAVRECLRTHDEVASREYLYTGTDVSAWYVDQIASTDTFYTRI